MTTSPPSTSRRLRLVLSTTAALALSLPTAWAQSGSGGTSGVNASGAATGSVSNNQAGSASGRSADGSLVREDSNMLADLAHANIAEIETGKLALEKSRNEQVRKFAQHMIDDHGSALKELQALAQAKGMTLPDSTDLQHKAMATALRVMTGDTFDKQYLNRVGVNDHERTLTLLQKAQQGAKDPDLKALAGKMIPTVQQHLGMAREMSGQADKTSGKSGGKSTGSSR